MQAREDEETAAAVSKAMAAAEAGREKLLAQYLTKQRAKHSYPDSWPQRGVVKETALGVTVTPLTE